MYLDFAASLFYKSRFWNVILLEALETKMWCFQKHIWVVPLVAETRVFPDSSMSNDFCTDGGCYLILSLTP